MFPAIMAVTVSMFLMENILQTFSRNLVNLTFHLSDLYIIKFVDETKD